MDIQELAERTLKFFESAVRRPQGGEPQSRFYKLTNRYPTWVYDMVYGAHGDMLPDDHKYEYIVDTLHAISEGQDPEDGLYDIEADVYHHDLIRWLQSHGERTGFVDEATSELGHHPEMGIMGDIMMGQLQEKQQVWQSVVHALNTRLEEIEMGEPEVMTRRDGKEGRKDWDPR